MSKKVENITVRALNNCAVVDRSVDRVSNPISSYIDTIAVLGASATPVNGDPIALRPPSVAEAAALAPYANTALDLVAFIPGGNDLALSIAALYMYESYMNFTNAATHTVYVGTYDTVAGVENLRELTIVPETGVDAIIEYLVLPTQRAFVLSQNVAANFMPLSGAEGSLNFFNYPWGISTDHMVFIIVKDLQAAAKTASVTALYTSLDTHATLTEMFLNAPN